MIHRNTVTEELLQVARQLCKIPELKNFRIVGGTAVALHLGHRESVDIDFFTDVKIDQARIKRILQDAFPESPFDTSTGSISSVIQGVKVEIFDDWITKFQDDAVIEDGLRLASLMDLAALKLDAIVERREKKDYIDLYVLFKSLGAVRVLEKFKSYNPHVSEKSVMFALNEVTTARDNKTVMPRKFIDVSWKQIEASMRKAAQDFLDNRSPGLKVRRRGPRI